MLRREFVHVRSTVNILTLIDRPISENPMSKKPLKVTLQLHPQPEVVASAVCQFSEVNDAVQSTIEALQYNVPIARVELLDNNSIIACNDYSSTGLGINELTDGI